MFCLNQALSQLLKKKKKIVLSHLPHNQEKTHIKAMQLNHQILCMYRLKIYTTYFNPITTLFSLIMGPFGLSLFLLKLKTL